MKRASRLIVFDCDGTLVDSQHLIVQAMQLSFANFNLPVPDREIILNTVGLSIPEAIAALSPALELETRQKLGQAYRDWNVSLRQTAHLQEPMFAGIQSLILRLADCHDTILGIATGKSRRGVTRFIEQNSLAGVFLTIQTADDAPSKPHPAMLLQAMHEACAEPESTVMIGDTTYDMAMAVRASVTPIGVNWGHHTPAELRKAGAEVVVESVSELAKFLLQSRSETRIRAAAA